MKRTQIVALVLVFLLAFALMGCSPAKQDVQESGKADSSENAQVESDGQEDSSSDSLTKPAADVAEVGFDFYEDAVTWEEAKEMLGPIPMPTEELTLGFVCKAFENEFWRTNKEGAEAAAVALNEAGIKVVYDVRAAQGEADEQGQLAILNDMVNKGYDGIVLSPIADGNLLPGVEKAVGKEIEMVVNNDAFMPEIDVTCGAWHWQAGELAAEWINEQIGGEGQVAVIQGTPKNPAARSRTESFKQWFADNNPDVEIVDVQNGDWDRMKSKDITDTWMKKFPELKAIYANNDTMAMGAIEAVKTAGKVGDCLVIGTDGTSEAYDSIKNGELSATVDCFPFYMSQISTEMLIRKLAGQEVPKVIYTPQVVIDITNCDADPAEVIGWEGFNFAE